MAREFSVILERYTAGYYVASVPALRGCHTQAGLLAAILRDCDMSREDFIALI